MGGLRFLLPALFLFIFFPPFFFADQIQSEKIREGYLQDLRLMKANRLKAEADEEFEKSKYREAAAKYEESLKIFEQINDKGKIAEALYHLGRVYKRMGTHNRATEYLEKALKAHEQLGDRRGIGSDMTEIAEVQIRISRHNKSLEISEQALRIHEEVGNKKGMADTLRNMGEAYRYEGRYNKATECGEKSLAIAEEIGDKWGMAASLNNIGNIRWHLSNYAQALEYYQKALKMREEIGDKSGIALSLHNIGLVHWALGNYSQALEYYQKALKMREEIGDKRGVAYSLQSIGLAQQNLCNYPQALEYDLRSLKMFEEIGDKSGIASSFNNMGIVQEHLSNYAQALECYRKALRVFEETENKTGVASSLEGIGSVQQSLGNYTQALEYEHKALKIFEETGNKWAMAVCFNGMGYIQRNLNNYTQALEYYQKALKAFGEIGDKNGVAYSLRNVGIIQQHRGNYAQALEYFQKSLKTFEEIGNKSGVAFALSYIGSVHYKRKEMLEAHKDLSEAINISKQIGSQEILWYSLHLRGLVFRGTGQTEEAVISMKEAIEVIENIRSKLEAVEQKTEFLTSKLEVYEDLITLLATAHNAHPNDGHDREAFYYAERAKARAFLDLLEESRASVNISEGIDQDLLRSEREFEARLSNLRVRLDREHSKPKPDKNKTSQLEREQDEVYRAYEELKNEMRKRNPRYAELKYPKPSNLVETQKLLDNGSVLLEYLLGKEASFLFAITKSDYRLLTLPRQEEMERLVAGLRKILHDSSDQSGYEKFARVAYKLHSILIKPAYEMLRGKRRIMISADGYLHYLPFEALLTESAKQDSAEGLVQLPYLIKKYDISYIPSASVLHQLQTRKKSSADRKELLVFADPIYPSEKLRGGKRVASLRKANSRQAGETEDGDYIIRSAFSGERGMETLTRLVYSGKEAMEIASIVGKARSDLFLRERATEDNLKYGVKLDGYKIVHFAAHGIVNENKPQFSAIALTQKERSKEDGYLQMYEVFNLNLNADLVVLSACKSGLGKKVDGEGLVGLTRAFMYAGAASLVVSLWDTQDRATSEFMKHFYSHLKSGKDKAEALRLAKLEMTNSPRPLWRHPFYWAAFVLVGNVNYSGLQLSATAIR